MSKKRNKQIKNVKAVKTEPEVLEETAPLEKSEYSEAPAVAEEAAAVEETAVEEAAAVLEETPALPLEPKTVADFTAKKLLSCACLLTAFAFSFSSLITPYRDPNYASPPITTEVVPVSTTAPPVTEPETTEPETTDAERPTAEPVTKRYTPPANKPKVNVAAPSTRVDLVVPYVSQNPDFPTGCEAASATMLLNYYGIKVTLHEMVAAIPRENLYSENGKVYGPSIYEKFVGDPAGTYDPVAGSNRRGYGAFAPVITKAMNRVIAKHGGAYVAKNITGASVDTLFNYVRAGHPVIIWGTFGMQDKEFLNTWWIKTATGEYEFSYPKGTHVLVLTGFDAKRAFFSDPWSAGTRRYYIGPFADKYQLLGRQAIIIEKGLTPVVDDETSGTTGTTKKPSTTLAPPDEFEYVTDEFGERVTDEHGNDVTKKVTTAPPSSEPSQSEEPSSDPSEPEPSSEDDTTQDPEE